ncbi:MAG: hypothetical protein HON53_01950, partial [Planctomycetaceae bacterium]|nr:hypothetical protein [Planctomycetaceae bacterium]
MVNSTATKKQTGRMLPGASLPTYTFIPGTDTPHPYRDQRGHSYGQKNRAMKPLPPDSWADNRNYLLA